MQRQPFHSACLLLGLVKRVLCARSEQPPFGTLYAVAFSHSVFLLPGHCSPNQAKRQHDPICHRLSACWSIMLANSLSPVWSVTCLLQQPFPAAALAGLRRSVVCRAQDQKLAPSVNDDLCFLLTLLFPTVILSDCETWSSCFTQYCWELIQAFVLLLVSINLALLLKNLYLRCFLLLLLLPLLYAGLAPVSQTPCPVLVLPTCLHSQQAVLCQEPARRRGAQGSLQPCNRVQRSGSKGWQHVLQQSLLSLSCYPARKCPCELSAAGHCLC